MQCKTLVLPVFDYCDYVHYDLNNLCRDIPKRLQNCALKNIFRIEKRTSTVQVHKQLEMPMLDNRRAIHVAENMFKFVNKLGPSRCNKMFTAVSKTHKRNTRSATNKLLKVPRRRVKTTKRGMSYVSVVEWNMIPLETRECETLPSFKSQLKAEIFQRSP